MRTVIWMLIASVATLAAQSDIKPDSHSRLPVVKREQMDENGKRVYDLLAAPNKVVGPTGPAAISLYSPGVAEPIHQLNQYLRRQGVLGPRLTEIAVLVAAREIDQAYEWSGHEPAAVRAGVEQPIIDTIKFGKEISGLGEKETTIIRFGRQLFREKKLDSAVFAKATELFGQQGTVELAALMGDYAMAGIMLHAVDQHIPPDRPNAAVLPKR